MTNIVKVREMCVLVRKHLPKATIVIGGHIANNADLPRIIDADHIVRGDGVRWFRKYLGQDENKAVRHPNGLCGFWRSDCVLQSYTIEQLVALGISWVWMGLEGENSL